jgi:hypothetical protein
VGVGARVGVRVGVAVGRGVTVGVAVAVGVGVGVRVGVGVGVAPAIGAGGTTISVIEEAGNVAVNPCPTTGWSGACTTAAGVETP